MKECKYKGPNLKKEYGCVVCMEDGSVRLTVNCNKEKCPFFKRARLGKIGRWLKYGKWA